MIFINYLERLRLDFKAGLRSEQNLFFTFELAACADLHRFQRYLVIEHILWHVKNFITSLGDFLAKLSGFTIHWDFEDNGNGWLRHNVFICLKELFRQILIQWCGCEGGKCYYFLEVFFELFELCRGYLKTAVAFLRTAFEYVLWFFFLEPLHGFWYCWRYNFSSS